MKSFFGNFYRHLAIFSGHTAGDLVRPKRPKTELLHKKSKLNLDHEHIWQNCRLRIRSAAFELDRTLFTVVNCFLYKKPFQASFSLFSSFQYS